MEIGIHYVGHSKNLDEYRQTPFDKVITVCDAAAEERPLWLGVGRRVHIGFPDPAKATGTEDEIIRAFRNVRDDNANQKNLAQIPLAQIPLELNNLN